MRVYRFAELQEAELCELCRRNPPADPDLLQTCREIFAAVRERGDAAIREYTSRFDGVDLDSFEAARDEWERAARQVPRETGQALERAAANIRKFHAGQAGCEEAMEVEPGITCWRESRPIESVGLYVPGGTAVLPSTLLMLAVPARLAGCTQVVACVPPRRDGTLAPEIVLAAELSGVDRLFKIGGAQAIAAMALGTETVPQVLKILGPGNRWVQAAKLLAVLEGTAIDMVAGPSEVVVIADDSADPNFVAADLIAQAEHGVDSQAVLLTDSSHLLQAVLAAVRKQLSDLPRRKPAQAALENSFALYTRDLEEALQFANLYGPEHLILQVREPDRLAAGIRSAGSVFLGPWTPEVAGDYASGTNHTLPTSGLARAFSGVSLDTFLKKMTFQKLTRDGLRSLAPTLERLAMVEGLEGHRRAVSLRLDTASGGVPSETGVES